MWSVPGRTYSSVASQREATLDCMSQWLNRNGLQSFDSKLFEFPDRRGSTLMSCQGDPRTLTAAQTIIRPLVWLIRIVLFFFFELPPAFPGSTTSTAVHLEQATAVQTLQKPSR